jgi:hypothetical protein
MGGASRPGVGCWRETQPSPARSAGLGVVRIVGLAAGYAGHRVAHPGTARARRGNGGHTVNGWLGQVAGGLVGSVGLARGQLPIQPTCALSVRFVGGFGQAVSLDSRGCWSSRTGG